MTRGIPATLRQLVLLSGLGLLAGDHLKAASELGLPLVGVSLMYREGYFRQYLNVDGWQQESYPENDFFNLPLIPENGPDGKPLLVSVPLPVEMIGPPTVKVVPAV